MRKRSTIGRDPLLEARSDFLFAAETNVVELATVTAKDSPTASPNRSEQLHPHGVTVDNEKAGRAIGGRLELFGGDLGSGTCVIWRHGANKTIGFVAPTGRFIDFATELAAVESCDDRTEHRILSTLGWAWIIGSLGGVIGIIAGGGLRLLAPRRVIVQMRLTDGSKLVVRTDSVTESGLRTLAQAHASVTA